MENKPAPPRRGMLYENAYVWLIFVSSMDIMMTWVVLWNGGREVNALAAAIIRNYGLQGMVVYKLLLVIGVIGICEAIGRRNLRTGKRFAAGAVLLSAAPVVVAFVLLGIRRLHF
jgi:hypothetical protein